MENIFPFRKWGALGLALMFVSASGGSAQDLASTAKIYQPKLEKNLKLDGITLPK